jgi:lipid-binding SYLF domain-containing protein
MVRHSMLAAAVLSLLLGTHAAAADNPEETVREADQSLHEIMAIPFRRIPDQLLAQAQGVAIIPNVIKVGFIGGIRRGRGVVLVKDNEGEWGLPQFVTLTGGSVGWQAGIQATDVILVFMTPKSIQGLMSGQFTIGADASAAAGPVGRSAAAATDGQLKAEILSYSRNRGLFAGVSLDGSAIQIDEIGHASYYGSQTGQPPLQIPDSARQLLQDVTALSPPLRTPAANLGTAPPPNAAARADLLRRALVHDANTLAPLLVEQWREYLALPPAVSDTQGTPSPEALRTVLTRFDAVAKSPDYAALAQRPEFQATYETLREYTQAVSAASEPQLALPPPPVGMAGPPGSILPPAGR